MYKRGGEEIKTTLNKIRAHNPCADGWEKLLTYLGKTKADDEPLAITTILDSNGIDDAIWCLRAVEGRDKEIRLFAVWCARQVQHLLTDQRSLDVIDVAERYANGEATQDELAAATDAAWAAVRDARDVGSSGAAAWATAWHAADVADDAWAAAWHAAGYAADATRAKQEAELRRICGEG